MRSRRGDSNKALGTLLRSRHPPPSTGSIFTIIGIIIPRERKWPHIHSGAHYEAYSTDRQSPARVPRRAVAHLVKVDKTPRKTLSFFAWDTIDSHNTGPHARKLKQLFFDHLKAPGQRKGLHESSIQKQNRLNPSGVPNAIIQQKSPFSIDSASQTTQPKPRTRNR